MKTTLIISDAVMAQVKRAAARQNCTMSFLVESALRLFLAPKPKTELPPLPTFNGGNQLVNIDDRDALYDAMEDL